MSKHTLIHLGIGNFFRAHQAIYTQLAGDEWEMIGVSLRHATVRDQLRPYDYKYIVVEKSQEGESDIEITQLKNILVAPESPQTVLDQMTDNACKIVSLTITEKGYYVDPVSAKLQLDHPDVIHDMRNLENPRTAVGFIVSALKRRYRLQREPFTVLSCDNLSHNGYLLKNACLDFARSCDFELADWIAATVAFPSTMVDRIVPASSLDDMSLNRLICEPFKQWVLENNFCNVRPRWELAGAQFVSDVAPYEKMKLRLLNASHSALAYLGFLSGYEYIYQAVSDLELRNFIFDMMTYEIIPYLEHSADMDLFAYRDVLLHRFANPTLPHKTYQVAMDGSQKLPQRIFPSIIACLRSHANCTHLLQVVAAWIRYTSGIDGSGRPFEVQDPLASRMAEIHLCSEDLSALISNFQALEVVFPKELRGEDFAQQLEDCYFYA